MWHEARSLRTTDSIERVNELGSRPMRNDEVLALAARDDRAAFLTLYDRYAARVGRYVSAHISDSSDAEDVVSIVFMRVLERIDQYRPERGSFAGWLFGIARNMVREHYRRGWRFVPAVATNARDIGPSAEDTALYREQLGTVGAAVRQLTPDQRDALALRYVAGLSYVEIGRVMGKNDEACRKLTGRAVDSLRRTISEEDQR